MSAKVTQLQSSREPLFVGIDGGGTKCKAIIYQNDVILGTGVAGPANPFHGYEQAIDSILTATNKALADAELSPHLIGTLTAGMGLAGVNLPQLFDKVSRWQHPFKQMFLTTDLHIACIGAHKGQDGAVIITGTGSCGYSSSNDNPLVVGAHGFPHGDKGSGAWFGFTAVEKVLLAMDGLAEKTLLEHLVPEVLGCRNDLELVEKINGQKSRFFAQLAGLVFDAANAGDNVAKSIIKDGADYISDLARKLLQTQPRRLSMIGGLAPLLSPYLDEEVQDALATPLAPPEVGAIYFAKSQMAQVQTFEPILTEQEA